MRLLRAYWKINNLKTLFPWQIECLTKLRVAEYNINLIFSAPTSAGKSLVADLYLLKPLTAMQQVQQSQLGVEVDPSEKPLCLYIVPYVSLITEKETKLKPLLVELELSIVSMHSHKRAILSTTEPPDIALCTI